jgi:hypothetical protein
VVLVFLVLHSAIGGCPPAPNNYTAYPGHYVGLTCSGTNCTPRFPGTPVACQKGLDVCVADALRNCTANPRCKAFALKCRDDDVSPCDCKGDTQWQTFALGGSAVVQNSDWLSYTMNGPPTPSPPPTPPPPTPPPTPRPAPTPRPPCTSDLNCSLNGLCTAGSCVISLGLGKLCLSYSNAVRAILDTTFFFFCSAECGVLKYKVTPVSAKDLYPYNNSGPRVQPTSALNTWGGPIVGPVNGKYHMYNSLYQEGSLCKSTTIMHGVADTITGPYDWFSRPHLQGRSNPMFVVFNGTDGKTKYTLWNKGNVSISIVYIYDRLRVQPVQPVSRLRVQPVQPVQTVY